MAGRFPETPSGGTPPGLVPDSVKREANMLDSRPTPTSATHELALRAREAAWTLASLSTEARNRALREVLAVLEESRDSILEANRADIEAARQDDLAGPLLKRLDLSGDKYEAVLEGLRDLIELPDPVGVVDHALKLDEGLELRRVSCPIGVLGIIFESRPDAAVQIATLSIKSGNAVLLKGGREAAHSNLALVNAIREGLRRAEVPEDAVQNLATREEAQGLLALDDLVDLIIPRGSNELVKSIQSSTRIPVLGHADGICSVYLDRAADLRKAVDITVDAKTQYPAVCNAAETLLVHADVLETIFPEVASALTAAGVTLRCDERSRPRAPGSEAATEEDWKTEYLDLTLAVRVVDSIDEAIQHINTHGSHHTDAIVTEDEAAAAQFQARVDSAGVFHNCSTRFADGFRFGFGAEVGVSTCKTHARGPVGLEGLVIYKYRLNGQGHRVADFGPGKKPYLHEPLDGSA